MDFFIVLVALLVRKVLDFIRYVVHGDVNGMVSQIVAWLLGILVVYCLLWSEWPGVPDTVWQRILWGMVVGSAASTVHDFLCAWAKTWSHRPLVTPTATTPTA